MVSAKKTLPIIILSQFCCTSLWFAGNGVMGDLLHFFDLKDSALGHLTSAVQFGFITGTLTFAVLTIADRFSPSKVFFFSAVAGAVFNLGMMLNANTMGSLLTLRFLTGFFLAGIYPVGMKIAADYHKEGLGKALGYLVGALVLGTALPHLLKALTVGLPWKLVLIITSGLAILGGTLVVWLVPDGPYRKPMQRFQPNAILKTFQNPNLRSAAFGYFGHMWELYAFWAFVPVMLSTYAANHSKVYFNIPVVSFVIIALGGLACALGGHLSEKLGVKKIAIIALSLSGLCCLASPMIFMFDASAIFITFLAFWGMVVIADSPLFSTLVAHSAAAEFKGTSLTIVNCIGFSITILSIQLLNLLSEQMDLRYMYVALALGPILGVIAVVKKNVYAAESDSQIAK